MEIEFTKKVPHPTALSNKNAVLHHINPFRFYCLNLVVFWFFANQFTVMGAFEMAAKIHFQRFLD